MLAGLPEECTEVDQFLRSEGFKCHEQETADSARWRRYTKEFRKHDSNVMLRLVIRFELTIHDDPRGSYDDNHELCYEDCYLLIFDRQMLVEDGLFAGDRFYDEETESLRKLDRYPIRAQSYDKLMMLAEMIC